MGTRLRQAFPFASEMRTSPSSPRRLPFHLTVPETSLWYNLEVSATRFPSRPALIFGGGDDQLPRFHAQCEALAGFLQKECGVRRGDRVALFMHNSPQFVIAYYGILRADAVVVPINCMNTTGELEHPAADAGATTIITAQELQPRVEPLARARLCSAFHRRLLRGLRWR